MTWLYVWLGICLGYIIVLNIRSIKHLRRISYLESKEILHTNRLNLQHERIDKLEEELNNLKKGNK